MIPFLNIRLVLSQEPVFFLLSGIHVLEGYTSPKDNSVIFRHGNPDRLPHTLAMRSWRSRSRVSISPSFLFGIGIFGILRKIAVTHRAISISCSTLGPLVSREIVHIFLEFPETARRNRALSWLHVSSFLGLSRGSCVGFCIPPK